MREFSISLVLLSKALRKYLGLRTYIFTKTATQKESNMPKLFLILSPSLSINCNFSYIFCHENSEYRNIENNFKHLKT